MRRSADRRWSGPSARRTSCTPCRRRPPCLESHATPSLPPSASPHVGGHSSLVGGRSSLVAGASLGWLEPLLPPHSVSEATPGWSAEVQPRRWRFPRLLLGMSFHSRLVGGSHRLRLPEVVV